jgi:type I restriction enzyme S subunit
MSKSLSSEFSFLPKTGRAASFASVAGAFPFFTSSQDTVRRAPEADCYGPALVFGTGGSASIHVIDGPFSASNDCYVCKPDSGKMDDAKFVYYFLKSNIHLIEEGFKGAGLKHVSKKHLMDLPIPASEGLDRRHVITILDKADAIQRKRDQALALADDFLRSVFLEMFGDPTKIGNHEPNLSEFATISRGRFSPRPRNDPRYYNGNFPFIQTGEIANAVGYLSEYRQTLNEAGTKVSKSFPAGTVFIAIVGATIGATTVSTKRFWCPDSVIGIVPKSRAVPAEFIEFLLRFWRPVFVATAPSTARANINLQTLNVVRIPKADTDAPARFAEIFKRTYGFKQKLEQMDSGLLPALSQRAFSGDL